MVIHICQKCGKEFKKKSHYLDHINKKNPCIENKKLIQNNPNNLINDSFSPTNLMIFSNENDKNNESIQCGYCKKIFYNNANLNKHLRNNSCKVKKQDDENKENIFKLLLEKDKILLEKDKLLEKEKNKKEKLNNKIEDLQKQLFELTKSMKELNKKTIINIKNANINTQNNLIIPQNKLNKFGSEKVELIDNKLFENVINKIGKNIFTECAKNIYANPKHPEFSNIYMSPTAQLCEHEGAATLSDLSRDKCLTWGLTNTNQAMVTVENQIRKYFIRNKDKYEKLNDPKIKKDFDIRVQKYYNLYYEEFEDDEKEPSKERIDQFKESVNNDLKKFFYNIRIDVKNI